MLEFKLENISKSNKESEFLTFKEYLERIFQNLSKRVSELNKELVLVDSNIF
jgi:hypothetical protein